jgi:sec-independent protein translocase protein TatB
MFDFDASKLLIVGVIALIFIPPKDLPRVLRQVGQFVGKMRRMATDFQGQFMDAMREADMADLRREAQKLADSAKVDVGLDSVTDLKSHLTGAIEGKPLMLDTATSTGEQEGLQEGLVDPNPELRRLVGADPDPATPPASPAPESPAVSHSA